MGARARESKDKGSGTGTGTGHGHRHGARQRGGDDIGAHWARRRRSALLGNDLLPSTALVLEC
ncbi:hypothetical protein TYRP_015416 [Tyrophagus putrescentiae]|nr:hypothetical protein TYRP_015416 [Tyrophagus putrescentiae]